MGKRPANGEAPEYEATPNHKRARREATSEQAPNTTGDAEYNEVMEDQDASGDAQTSQTQVQPVVELDDDEAFEAKYRARFQRVIEEKGERRKSNRIADYGTIQRVEMTNFMCHQRVTINLDPRINFIVGNNGSGKSAVLSAIAIALGGRSASTGRGTGLKSFIKEGQGVAEVMVILKNEGPDAYRPEVYGESIKITRRFTDKGSSSYTIKGAKDNYKKTISSRKEELTNITDHMDLQVDNPIVVLTQDTSRQFLASSKAKDKYQFFLNGTLLTRLLDDYQLILESLKKTKKIVESKQTIVPDLERQLTEAKDKYREAKNAKQKHERMTELEREMVWAHMKLQEAGMETRMTNREAAKKNAEKAQDLVREEEDRLERATQAVNAANEQEDAQDNTATLEERRKAIREDIKAKKNKLLEVKNQKLEMNNALQQSNSTIKTLTERIQAEEAKLQDGRQELREKLNMDMEKVQRQLKTEEESLSECQADIANINQLVQAKKEEWREICSSRERIRDDITSVQQNILRLQHTQQHQINKFGNNLDRVLTDVSRARWHGQPPLGPLGQYVEVKDARWAPLMRVNLGSLMSSFAVTDQRDRETLSRILQKHDNSPNIIVAEIDIFDFSGGEPPARLLTPLRVLNIKHDWVVRLLINSAYIERTCITNTRADAQRILDTEPSVFNVLSADMMRSQKYGDGGFFTSALRQPRQNDRSNMYFTDRDPAESIRLEQEKLQGLEQEHAAASLKMQEIETEGKKSEAKVKELQKLESTLRRKVYELKDELNQLNELAEEEAPASVQGFHEARKEEESHKQSVIDQFTAVAEREATLNSELKPLVVQLEDIRKQAEQIEQRKHDSRARLEPLTEKRLMHAGQLEHYRSQLDRATQELEEASIAEDNVVKEYEACYTEALTISQPIDTDRHPDTIEADIKALKNALRDGGLWGRQSLEEIAQELQSAKETVDKAQEELAATELFIKGLNLALDIRFDAWYNFRKRISVSTKQLFSYYLGQRGFRGTIEFDHYEKTLNLRVITDEANPHAKDKDPKALSGGEKSFSTICLVMSLWDVMECPIRCLDEFDVFMDQVNRRIAMKSMVQTAKASDNKQYVIITPLGVSLDIGQGVRIHKMADPERGQSTLD
ncbi:Structural maintenance of chromosomes protein 6 [Ceratobasidium sp. 395]|nr:Structural maintenance of chromosomes protein 6 [Ceratobasidium sp. 395]